MKQRLKRKANREVYVLASVFWTIYAALSLKINEVYITFRIDPIIHLTNTTKLQFSDDYAVKNSVVPFL